MIRVLIAEDDTNSRMLLKKIIDPVAECDVAEDGEEAIEKYVESISQNRPYQLVFLDIMMPKYNGIEVMEKIREREQESGLFGNDAVSIVMTTALDDEQKIFEAHVTGCLNYLVKPINKKSVIEQIKYVEQSINE